MEAQNQPKWEGKASVELTGIEAQQIWPFLEDFFGLNKWFPTLTTCLPVEGISGQPGCVRYCAGFKTPVDNKNGKTEVINWTKQKLLFIDPKQMVFTYSIVDGNVGFYGYVSTVKVIPKDDVNGHGCEIEWKYEVEPPAGWEFKDLDFFISAGLQVMANRMSQALRGELQIQ